MNRELRMISRDTNRTLSPLQISNQNAIMPNLLYYGLYLDSKEGTTPEQMSEDYGLPIDEIDERLAAAELCFDKQIDHIEFDGDF